MIRGIRGAICLVCGSLLLCVARPGSAYEVFGGVVAAAGVGATNSNYSASFTAGLPVVGGGSNGSYRVDHSFWTPGGSLVVGVDGPELSLPGVTRFYQNRPNPFRGGTLLVFDVSGAAGVSQLASLDIFDVSGRLVRTLVDGSFAPGRYEVKWDGMGEGGRPVATGVYLARFSSGAAARTVRMVVVR